MIAIKNADGDLIKVIRNHKEGEYGFHRVFGFTSSDKAKNRIEMRRRRGFEFTRDEWDCKFNLMSAQNGVAVTAGFGCQVERLADDSWNLSTPRGIFNIGNFESAQFVDCLSHQADENDWLGRLTEILMLGIFLLIPLVYFLMPEEAVIEEDVDKKKEAITVQVIKPVNTVKVKQTNPNLKIKPLNKVELSKRAVKRNLGFLGLVGSKDLSKVTGGVPQKLKKATAGAGKGGDAGSGGEVLTGVGKGLKKITVGNTGVAGLGGVGTKGAGGGKGGYGNTMVASGSGKGISGISVASNDLVLEGGLSRYAINATIAKYLSQVRRCYENELNKTPGLEGLVTVAFQINGQGGLNFSKVLKSSLGSPAAESCITKKMMNWKFPKPKGGVNVNINYPFMLRPVGS